MKGFSLFRPNEKRTVDVFGSKLILLLCKYFDNAKLIFPIGLQSFANLFGFDARTTFVNNSLAYQREAGERRNERFARFARVMNIKITP